MNSLYKSVIVPFMVCAPMSAYTPDGNSSREDIFVQQEKFVDELMTGKSQSQKDAVKRSWQSRDPEKMAIEAQSSVDSLAYRRLFEGTKLANDSGAVAEFNKIPKNSIPNPVWGFPTYSYKMDEIMRKLGVSQEEIYKLKAENQVGRETFSDGSIRYTSRDNKVARAKYQFNIDSVAYQRFFEKHDLLDKDVLNEIKNISKKFKPVM